MLLSLLDNFDLARLDFDHRTRRELRELSDPAELVELLDGIPIMRKRSPSPATADSTSPTVRSFTPLASPLQAEKI